jgi:hypothetical protein
MSERTSPAAVDPLYVAARSVLLDALTALQPHGLSVIVAGAQAIYLRTGDANLAIAPYTTDGDLTIDPAKLAETPTLEAAMLAANFELSTEPGIWLATTRVGQGNVQIPVDLIVPEGVATGAGRRDARLQRSPRRTSCTSASSASARPASTTRTQPTSCASCKPPIQPTSQTPSPQSPVTRLPVSRPPPRLPTSTHSSEHADAQASRWLSAPYEPHCHPSGYKHSASATRPPYATQSGRANTASGADRRPAQPHGPRSRVLLESFQWVVLREVLGEQWHGEVEREAESTAIERELVRWPSLATSIVTEVELPRAVARARQDRVRARSCPPVGGLVNVSWRNGQSACRRVSVKWSGSEPVDGAVEVATVDDACHQVARVGLVGELAVEHPMLTDSQTTPRSMSSHWLDVQAGAICFQRLECPLHPLARLGVQALQVADRSRS